MCVCVCVSDKKRGKQRREERERGGVLHERNEQSGDLSLWEVRACARVEKEVHRFTL